MHKVIHIFGGFVKADDRPYIPDLLIENCDWSR